MQGANHLSVPLCMERDAMHWKHYRTTAYLIIMDIPHKSTVFKAKGLAARLKDTTTWSPYHLSRLPGTAQPICNPPPTHSTHETAWNRSTSKVYLGMGDSISQRFFSLSPILKVMVIRLRREQSSQKGETQSCG